MKENIGEKLVSVDLHVHTPESKCYISNKLDIDDEYISLLEKYNEKDIKVMAITDHNTIEGYKKMMQIKKHAEEKIKLWSELEEIDIVKQKIELEQDKINLFNKILILPGVEFQANPGVHLLLIFNPDIDIKLIEDFIEKNGYPREVQGMENPEISSKSTLEIIQNARELGAITIAAHVDSDKGALTVLPKGMSRAQFFRSEHLMAIQVVNLAKIEYLKTLYQSNEYRRNQLPAFIRCSDFHNDKDDIENYVTYMMLSELNFDSVKDALLNSIECISFTENPEYNEILKQIIEQKETYIFKDINKSSHEELKKCICCMLNDGTGTIVIGIGEDKSILGIKKTKQEFEDIIKSILQPFEENKAFYRYSIKYYDYGNHIVPVIRIKSIKKVIYNANGNVYIKKNNKIAIANYNDLAKIGEENYRKSFNHIHEINKKKIDKINKELDRIKLLEDNISLYMKIKDSSLTMKDVANISFIDKTIKSSKEINNLNNGDNEGNIYYIDNNSITFGPHTKECYIRITCPRTSQHIESLDSKKYIGESIIVSMGGASYYIEGKEEYQIASYLPIIKIDLKDEFKSIYSLKCIVGWLKSPILLTVLDLLYDSCDLFMYNILPNIPIIMNDISKENTNIESYINEIIALEYKILESINLMLAKKDTNTADNIIIEHNREVSKLAIKIDEEISLAIDIKEEEYNIIRDFIESKNWEKVFIKENINDENDEMKTQTKFIS